MAATAVDEVPALETAAVDAGPPWRTLRSFALVRVLVAGGLLLTILAFGSLIVGALPPVRGTASVTVITSAAYFAAAVLLALAAFLWERHYTPQLAAQLTVDMLAIALLIVASGGLPGGLVMLFLLPLAGAALLLPTVATFFVCAVAVLTLLVHATLATLAATAGESLLFQTGLYGAALFAMTGLLRLLTMRLAEQQRLAALRGRDLVNQLEINRLVIAQMEQGVVVVEADTRVRANNRAARVLLGLDAGAQLTGMRLADVPALRPLAEAFTRWLGAERSSGMWSSVAVPTLGGTAGVASDVQLRARFARPPSATTEEFVIFLEDMRAVEERAQQLKLAAMGRLTASIAHEIRNPLAAISHAGQLLAEEAEQPLPRRLAGIVRENTERLNRLVEDVLRVARREPPLGDEIALGPFVQAWLAEFERDRDLPPGRIELRVEADVVVKFQQSHLRQVLFNLVDNALRYASTEPGAVQVVVDRTPDEGARARLWVIDDGPGVGADVRAALFEPFFTTHPGGTGLGLYIAREFCVANRSDLAHGTRRGLDGVARDGFVLRFAQSAGGTADDVGFLDTIPVR